MLILNNIKKIYKKNIETPVFALKDVSISLPQKGLVFIVGKSGSGKTTLLNIIGGIDSPTSGEVVYENEIVSNYSKREMDNYRNEKVGFVFQEYNLLTEYSVGKNIALALELQGLKPTREQVDVFLKKLDLVDATGETLYSRSVKNLSGGQKQRVAIARALIKNPDIILADEPTGALDHETSHDLYKILKDISKDKLVVVVSHDIENATKYGDRIIELSEGQIIKDSVLVETHDDPETITNSGDTNKKKRFRLSNLNAFKVSLSSIKSRPLKYIFSLITAAVATSLFCFSSIASTTDLLTAELKSCYENNVKFAVLKNSSTVHVVTEYEDGTVKKYLDEYETGLTEKQFEILDSQKDNKYLRTTETNYLCENFGANRFAKTLSEEEYNNPYNYLSVHGISRIVEIDKTSGAKDALLVPDERAGDLSRLPQNYSEIAITDYWADMFLRFGYKSKDGVSIQINNADELIGKELDYGLTICGIYETEEDKAFLGKYDKNQRVNLDGFLESYLDGEHIMNYGFVCDGFIENSIPFDVPSQALYKLKGNIYKDKKIIKKITYTYDDTFQGLRSMDYCEYKISAAFTTRYAGFASSYSFYTEPITIRVFVVIGSILCLLSSLILLNSLLTSLNDKKREFGILRALGTSGFGITKIFFFEVLVLSLLNFILSFSACQIACLIINKSFNYCLFNLGVIPFLVLLGVIAFIALLGSALPMILLGRKKPVDIIRDN